MFLKLRLQLLKKDKTPYTIKDTAQPHLTNNAFHSIFKSAFITLNSVNVRSQETGYNYKEFIETSLNYNEQTALSRLGSQLYIPNSKIETLRAESKNSVIFELYSKINLMNLSKLLLPNVTMTLRLVLESPDFYIKEQSYKKLPTDITEVLTESIMRIDLAKLYVRHVTASSDILLAHERILSSGKNAVYEYKRAEIYTHNIPANASNISIPHFYTGPKPSIIVFAMTKNSAFIGNRVLNPYLFEPNNINSFSFIVDGTNKPSFDLSLDENHNCINHAYSRMFESLNLHNTHKSNLITRDNFKTHFMLVEDLSVNQNALSDLNEASENVSIGVTATFTKALSETMTCILYVLVPSRFEITASRKVLPIL